MKTGSFKTYKGPGRIAISRGTPRFLAAGYRCFKDLAPGPWFNTAPKPEYEGLYAEEILAKLDPQKTWDKIHELAGGAEPVLLCFEVPPFTLTNFCHRRMAARWFETTLGILVPEMEFDAAKAPVLGDYTKRDTDRPPPGGSPRQISLALGGESVVGPVTATKSRSRRR